MKNRSLPAQLFAGVLLAAAALSLTACSNIIYREPAANYAGRPIPPSGLLERVMVAYTSNGSQGGLEILDGLRDIRSNVQNTIPAFFIKGFSAAQPTYIINFPEQTTGYILSYTDGSVDSVNYGTEAAGGSVAGFGNQPPSIAAAPGGVLFAGAAEGSGVLGVAGTYGSVSLNLPNVDKVVVNPAGTIVLAMVRNSNQLYRVVKMPATSNPVYPPGYIDCEPLLLPVYCVVPVGNTSLAPNGAAAIAGAAYDRPVNAIFSGDGSSVYVLNCGAECGGANSSVTILQTAPLLITSIPTFDPLCGQPGQGGQPAHPACPVPAPSPLATLAVANPIPVPGGATVAVADSNYLYIAGQQLGGDGLFAGNLSLLAIPNSTIPTNTPYTITNTYSIADGNHTVMRLADNANLWIGSQQCANGQRAANAAAGITTQAANYNCLTRFVTGGSAILPSWTAKTAYNLGQRVTDGTNVEIVLTAGTSGASAPSWTTNTNGQTSTTDGSVVWVNLGAVTPVQIIPTVTPNNATATNITVPNINTNQNPYYYGNVNGIAWVQNYGKVYTGYGGQVHAFYTSDGSELDNYLFTVQGTVLDMAYIDAESNSAD